MATIVATKKYSKKAAPKAPSADIKFIKGFYECDDETKIINMADDIIKNNKLEEFIKKVSFEKSYNTQIYHIKDFKNFHYIYKIHPDKKEFIKLIINLKFELLVKYMNKIDNLDILNHVYKTILNIEDPCVVDSYYHMKKSSIISLIINNLIKNKYFDINNKLNILLKYRFSYSKTNNFIANDSPYKLEYGKSYNYYKIDNKNNKTCLYDNWDNLGTLNYNLQELGDNSVIYNYYDIFLKCVDKGYIPSEEIFKTLLNDIIVKYIVYNNDNQYGYKESKLINPTPYGIINHCVNNFKYSIDVKKVDIITKNINKDIKFENIIQNCINVDIPFVINCYKNNVYINNLLGANIQELYHIYYENYVNYMIYGEDKYCTVSELSFENHATNWKNTKLFSTFSDIICKNLKDPQIIFREKFRKENIANIKKYLKINNTVVIDQYCINNAFISSNNKLIKLFLENSITPSNNILLLFIKIKTAPSVLNLMTDFMANKFKNEDNNLSNPITNTNNLFSV